MNQRATEYNLNANQFEQLKETYITTIVESMSTKDLVHYVTEDMQKWVDSLTFNEAMIELEEYFDDCFTDTIQDVIEGVDS